MSLIKNEFFEKKITHLLQTYPYVLIFHYNNITSKEWLDLKKELFQINPFIINKVIPNRFLFQLWKNLKFEQIKDTQLTQHSLNSLTIEEKYAQENTLNLQNFSEALIISEFSRSQIAPGSSCLFFCSTMEDLKQIFRIIEIQSQTKSSSKTDLRLTSSNLKFINIGMISMSLKNIDLKQNFFKSINKEIHKGASPCSPSQATFFNPYDIQKMLELDSHIFYKLSESLNRNEYLIINFHKFLNLSTHGKIFDFPRMIFSIQHYDLFNILSMRSSQMLKANNGN